MNDESLIKALRPGPECLPIEVLARLIDQQPESRDLDAQRHLAECAHCRSELALFGEFEMGTIRPEEKDAVAQIVSRLAVPARAARQSHQPAEVRLRWWEQFSWKYGLTAAFAVAAALLVGINVETMRHSADPSRSADVLRSAPLRAIAPVGDLDTIPNEFSWTAVPGASTYDLKVSEVDNTPLFESTITGTFLTIPTELRAQIGSGKTLQWIVNAQDKSNHEIATSGVHKFRTKSLQLK
jgi:hypothetical protein